MQFLDFDKLEAISPADYRAQTPYPWINPRGLLVDNAFETLRQNLPPLDLFESSFGVQRKNEQQAHDRYVLEYNTQLPVAAVWHALIRELCGERYKAVLCRLLDQPSVALNFHWHYTPNGCEVSPHADSIRKAGSHIFYFNTDDDWEDSWGGHTVILDDDGALPYRSSPRFVDFKAETACETIGNRSLLFSRTDHAWHGVRAVNCPEGKFRKVFIVVVNRDRWSDRLRRTIKRSKFHYF